MPIYLTLALCFFNFVGMGAARVILTLYALTLGASPSSVGVLGGMFYVFPLLLSWPIGTLADRYGSRRLLLVGSSSGALAMILPYLAADLRVFYLAAGLMGLALAFYHVTLQNAIGVLSKPEQQARNFSNFSLTGATTNFVGPLIAGFTIDHFGYNAACLTVVGLSVIALALLLTFGRLLPAGNPHAPASGGTIKSLIDPDVLRMIAATCLVQLGTDIFQFYIPIYGHSIALSATAIGYVLASFAAASFVVRLFLPRLVREVKGEKLLAWSFYAGAVGFVLVPFFQSVGILVVVAFVFGLGMGLGTPLTVILMFGRAAQGRSGQILGFRLAASNSVRVCGPMVFGAIGTAFGVIPVFVINAICMAAGGVFSHLQGKRDAR